MEELLKQLLACQPQPVAPSPASQSTQRGQEVLLDLRLDGWRYTLTRDRTVSAACRGQLSPREKEIVRLICGGLPNKTISTVLQISPGTVGTYLKRIFAKLQVSSRAEMVAQVLQGGLLEPGGRTAR